MPGSDSFEVVPRVANKTGVGMACSNPADVSGKRVQHRVSRSVVAVLAGAIAAVVAGTAISADAGCRDHADLVAPCFHVRGRAAFYNGNPTVRIWKVGTRRLLGVSARCQPPACEPLPPLVRAALDWEHAVCADFVVCPFTRARPGVMQMVCIDAASGLRRRSLASH
jgi:hypothetical protein